MRMRLGWTISNKSLCFVHVSLELVPLFTGMWERSTTLGSSSKGALEWRTSTGGEAFCLFICLDANKFETIFPKVSTKLLPCDAKILLLVDVQAQKRCCLISLVVPWWPLCLERCIQFQPLPPPPLLRGRILAGRVFESLIVGTLHFLISATNYGLRDIFLRNKHSVQKPVLNVIMTS